MLANPAVQVGSCNRSSLEQWELDPWTLGPFLCLSTALRQLEGSPSRRAEFVCTANSYKARRAPEAAKQSGCKASPELSLPTRLKLDWAFFPAR